MVTDTSLDSERDTSTAGETYYVLGDGPIATATARWLRSRGHVVADSKWLSLFGAAGYDPRRATTPLADEIVDIL